MRLALIAHDGKKDAMIALTADFLPLLRRCQLLATGTTGARLAAAHGLVVERMLSGPMGGDLQIGARLAVGELDGVIFLRDPMTPQPHEPDINALVRACDVHDVPCATNVATARLLLHTIVREVLIPESLPGVISGFTVTLVTLVGASAMAGAVGAGGLGDLAIRYGYQRFETGVMIAVVVVLIVLVWGMQGAGDWLARRINHR